MIHAFAWMPLPYRWALLAILFAGTLILALKMTSQGKPLRTDAAPDGILSYEFAWTQSRAEMILGSWGSVRDAARQQLITDFGFLVFYPLLMSLACAMLAESPHNMLPDVGILISWAVLAAAPLDAVENFALLRMLDLGASESLARLAAWCAGVKFLLVYSSFGYIVMQGLAILVGKMRGA